MTTDSTVVTNTRDNYVSHISLSTKEVIYKTLLQVMVVCALCIVVNIAIRVDFVVLGHALGESSVTEMLQIIMLVTTSLAFMLLAKRYPSLANASVLIAGFFFVLAIREMDAWFDLIFHGAWLYPALTVFALSALYAFRGGKRTLDQMAAILASRYMPILVTAVVVLLVFSRLYGMGSFWQHVMEEHYLRDVKNLSEEAIELLCYCLITYSAINTHITMKRSFAQGQNSD